MVALFLTASLLRSPTFAASVQLTAVRDNTMFSENTAAANGAGNVIFAGKTFRNDTIRRALIAFDLSNAIPAGSIVTSVSLTLDVTREPSTPPLNGTMHRVSTSWGEAGSSTGSGTGAPAAPGDATWSHRFFPGGVSSGSAWSTAGGDFAATPSATAAVGAANTTVTWASTPQMVADVQAWVDQPATNHGWAVLCDETVSGSATQFASREWPETHRVPRLTVEFTPASPSESDVPLSTLLTVAIAALALVVTGAFTLRRADSTERA